jgi:nucleotide-binding universal stress UspA family protein
MEKKILLAVDDTVHTICAMRYAVRMASEVTKLWFTLFYVQPTISQYLLEEAEKDIEAKEKLKTRMRKNHENAHGILEKLKNQMARMGIQEDHIDTHTQPKVLGLAKDIMDRAQQGLYDAIVVGRRGLSKVQKALMGSVTATLIEHASFIPVWVVDGEVTSSKIMLAVDGSESSLRAADHLSFMIGENPNVTLTLYHVRPSVGEICTIDFGDKGSAEEDLMPQGAKGCIDRFYARAVQIFKNAGIDEKRIEIKTSRPLVNIGKSIVNEAKKGNYGTVVIGRRGQSQSFFMGSVSRSVIDATRSCALWIVP